MISVLAGEGWVWWEVEEEEVRERFGRVVEDGMVWCGCWSRAGVFCPLCVSYTPM